MDFAKILFDIARQTAWKSEVSAINSDADAQLKKVAQEIQDVKTMSRGSFVDQLVSAGAELGARFLKLIEEVVDLVKAIDEIAKAYQNWQSTLVDMGKSLLGSLL